MLQTSTKGDTKKRMQAMVRKQAGRTEFTILYRIPNKKRWESLASIDHRIGQYYRGVGA